MKRLSEEQKLIKYHMEHGEAGWQSRLAVQFGKPVNAIYCASYRLMDGHSPHKQWSLKEKQKALELRQQSLTFKQIGAHFGVSGESARKIYYWMGGK